MNNYEAIIKMSKERLECFLDDVYVAGLNTGMYASNIKDEEIQDKILDENPFSIDWLNDVAEEAVLNQDDV